MPGPTSHSDTLPAFPSPPASDTAAMGRRAFLIHGSLFMAAVGGTLIRPDGVWGTSNEPALKLGLITDVHYADKDPAGNRVYRESIPKMRECVTKFNAAKIDVAVELGDFVDAAEVADIEIGYLKTIDAEYSKVNAPHYYVFGNHCVYTLTKEQFIAHCGKKAPYESFDCGSLHLIILDACFRMDGIAYGNRNYDWTDTNIPAEEQEWLKTDLYKTDKPTICFVHQRLDDESIYGIKQQKEVRTLLEQSEKVSAVFQGHTHENDYREINGIHYCTMAAMVEGSGEEHNSYGIAEIFPDGTIKVNGFRRQNCYTFSIN